MKTVKIKTSDLKPYPANAKIHPPDQVDKICKSIAAFRFLQPLVVDSNNSVVVGHGRLLAAKKLKLEDVPCVVADDLSEDEIRAYRLADNKLNESEWDMKAVEIELQSLRVEMQELTGFDVQKVEFESSGDEDVIPELPKIPKAKLGDIYQLGNHRLMCGDSTLLSDVKALLGDEVVDLVITDPPYNIDYDFSQNGMVQTGQRQAKFGKIKNDKMSDDEFKIFVDEVFKNMVDVMKPGGGFYIFSRRESSLTFNLSLMSLDFKITQWLVWVKEHFNISRLDYHPSHEIITYGWKRGAGHYWCGNRSLRDVLDFARDENAVHPTQKPLSLLKLLIENSSKQGNKTLDLFGGSGSTLIASEQTGRINYSMELDPRYIDVIIERWENFTGKQAKLILNAKEEKNTDS